MVALGFLTSPMFTVKEFRPFSRGRFLLANHTKKKIANVYGARKDTCKGHSGKRTQMNAESYNKPADRSLSSNMGDNAEKQAQYNFFSEQLGISMDSNPRQTRSGPQQSNASFANSSIAKETHEQIRTEQEAQDRVEVNPADYELFDQLLESTGGTGRKLVKGAKPFKSADAHQQFSRQSDWKPELSQDRSNLTGDVNRQQEEDIFQASDYDKGVKNLNDEPDSVAMSYELMREEFGEGFHGLGQRPMSDETNFKESAKTPAPVLQQRPKRPGHMEVPGSSNDAVPNTVEVMNNEDGEPSETTALTAESYDFMREEFGAGFRDVRQSPKSSDAENLRSAGNPPPVLQSRPKRSVHKERLQVDKDNKSAVEIEDKNLTSSGPPPTLNAPPQRRFLMTKKETLSFSHDIDQDPAQGLLNGTKRSMERDTIPKNVVDSIENTNELSLNNYERGHSAPSAMEEINEASNTSEGFDMGYSAAGKLPLLSRPERREESKENKLRANRRFGRSHGLSSEGRVRKPYDKAYVLRDPRLVRTQTMPSV